MFYIKQNMHLRNIVLILTFLVISSCSVQKRHYTNGYYISWSAKQKQASVHSKTKEVYTVANQHNNTTSVDAPEAPQNLDASASYKLSSNDLKSKASRFFPPEDSCDVLIFKDGSEVKVKVTEVGLNDIKYKRCNNLDGPNHISRKNEIFMIKYANGTKEVVKSEAAEPIKTYQPQQRTPTKTYNNKSRHLHPLAIPSFALGIGNCIVGLYCIEFILIGAPYAILIIPLVLGLAAFIMGKLAANDIKEHPDQWKGKGFTVPGIITGIVVAGIAAMLLFLFSMSY